MMNCGVILPEPGYLQGLKDLCHANGAYLAFDEVKTGATLAYGGAVEVFGVVPDIVCLAKAIGGGTPCGAIGATRELYQPIIDGTYDMGGHVQRQPAHDGGLAGDAAGGASPDAYEGFNRIDKAMKDGLTSVIEKTGLPAYVSGGREGLGDLLDEAGARVPRRGGHRRAHQLSPGSSSRIRVQVAVAATGPCSVWHTEDDAARYVANFEEFAKAVTA